jgi:Tfp pilus assembly protein PilF
MTQQTKQFPDQPEPAVTLGQIYFAQKDYAKAEASFRKALSIDKDSLPAYTFLGQLFIVQKSQDKAIQEFTNALKIDPNNIKAHILLSTIYDSKNDREKAKSHLREALRINAKSPIAANNLAWLLAETGGDLNEALKLAQTAALAARDSTAIQDTLGWIYYKKGSYQAAIDTLTDCVRKDPKNPTYAYHLGMAYLQKGDKAKAKASLNEALKLSQSFSGAAEARQALAGI